MLVVELDATGILITCLYLGIIGAAGALGLGELLAAVNEELIPVFCLLLGDPGGLVLVDPVNLPAKVLTVLGIVRVTVSSFSSVLGSPGLDSLLSL